MLEKLYAMTESDSQEAKSVLDFCKEFIRSDDEEDKFYAAIRDSRFAGYRDGMKAALQLIIESRA